MISGVMPGTDEEFPAVRPTKRAGREDSGRPASTAAGLTYLGIYSVTFVERAGHAWIVRPPRPWHGCCPRLPRRDRCPGLRRAWHTGESDVVDKADADSGDDPEHDEGSVAAGADGGEGSHKGSVQHGAGDGLPFDLGEI